MLADEDKGACTGVTLGVAVLVDAHVPLVGLVTADDLPGTVIVSTILDFGIRKTLLKTSSPVNPSTSLLLCFTRLNGAFGCTEIPDIPLTYRGVIFRPIV